MKKIIRIISWIILVVSLILFWSLATFGPRDNGLLLAFLIILGAGVLPLSVIGTIW